jgi:hypothetical protein
MPEGRAFANNDVAQIAWRYDNPIQDCLGFAIYRLSSDQPDAQREPLPAWVGFQGQSNPSWTRKTTEIWPIQKFEWKDLVARRGGTYWYQVVPMAGTPDALRPVADQAITCGPVTLTPTRGSFSTYFNRGILSTQFVAHSVPAGRSGAPNYQILENRIDQPGDPLRVGLAGQILEGLESLPERASAQGGACYAALYELNDPELVQSLLKLRDRLHIILSNDGPRDGVNPAARQALHANGADITDRWVPSGHIGHNKFVVLTDNADKPRAVLLGSTNWTDTAVCAQSNNALVVDNPDLAADYLEYWHRLKTDTGVDGRGPQGAPLRTADQSSSSVDLDNARATIWFAPNTPNARSSRSRQSGTEQTPPDLDNLFDLMSKAKQGILFLVFQPGKPSILDKVADISNANPGLFIRGAATDPNAVREFDTLLVHRSIADETQVVPATAVHDQFSFWETELLKLGPSAHAIIHDKIVVIDPFSDACVVATGSHNLGFEASYNNDENLLIVQGQKELAQAYTVHVLDVYDHYRFRYILEQSGTAAFSGLDTTDAWQKKYFDSNNPAGADARFWFP